MNFLTYIKELHMEKKRAFQILLAAECILLVIGAAGMLGKEEVYRFDGTSAVLHPNAEPEERAAEFQNISLPAGTYRVRLQYDTDMDGAYYCGVSDNGSQGKSLRTNGADLYAELQSTNYEMWLLQKNSLLTVYVESRGDPFVSCSIFSDDWFQHCDQLPDVYVSFDSGNCAYFFLLLQKNIGRGLYGRFLQYAVFSFRLPYF